MRVFKFRVWALMTSAEDGSESMSMLDWDNIRDWELLDICEHLDPREVTMQFTGLSDKNGKEIYEGDFLKSAKGKQGTIVRVQWSHRDYGDSIGFGAIGLDGDTEYNIHHFCEYGEVIGNIYENPELVANP